MVLFPPPFYFVFDISNLLSYIQNNFSHELARPIMGTIFLVIGERSEPLSRVFNDQPRDIYGGVRTYVQNASCYFSKLKLRSPIIVRTYVTPAAFDL